METNPLPPSVADPSNLDRAPFVLGASTGSFFIENIFSTELLLVNGPRGDAVNAYPPINETVPGGLAGVTVAGISLFPSAIT